MLEFWYAVEEWPLAMHIGSTWWFPLLESIHVLAAVMVFGSVLFVDLRLLGIAAGRYAVSVLLKDMLPWTWSAFAIALPTGISLFIVRPSGYAYNKAFIIKLILLLCAGVNMLFFHFYMQRSINSWNKLSTPIAVKFSGGISLMLWLGVLLAGRWTGHLI